jgi:ectoine hydroxylase-related dioxygenase (phytanoyl-CoA dioxygenase family)
MTTSNSVRNSITPEEKARLEADGFLRVGPVLTDEELAEARVNVDRIVAEQVRLGKRPEYAMAIHALDAYFMRLACHPRLLDILEGVMGPDIVLVSTHLLCKPPHDGHPVSWHQDGAFAPIEPMSLVTLYLALDDCDAGNGCMRMLPGSHKTGPARHDVIREGDATRKELSREVIDAYESFPLELHAGECSLHLPWTIHGSDANRSDRRRAALPMRYISGATRLVQVTDDNMNPEKQPVDPTAQVRWVRGQHLSESLRAVAADGRPQTATP